MTRNIGSRRGRGFSLVEVLVAVAILSFGLLALATLQIALVRASTEVKAQSQALALGKEKLEDLRTYTGIGGYTALASNSVGDSAVIGGVTYTRTWTVTRYAYNQDIDGDGILNEANDSGFQCMTTPCTAPGSTSGQIAGNEFKVINVNTTWADADGASQTITLTDATGSISPSDSANVSKVAISVAARRIPVIISNPASDTMVIPIAVGNGNSTAATNPKPLVVINNSTVETQFEVLTYAAIVGDNNNVVAQQRVETRMVGCTCDFASAPAANLNVYGQRPTYWDGSRYRIPERATYKALAGVDAVNDAPNQSTQCDICCRDHFDPAGTTGALFSPLRATRVNGIVTAPHDHYISHAVGATPVTSGKFREACRLIRVEGQWRVAADLNVEYFAQLATQGLTEGLAANNTGYYARTPVPDSTATTGYQAFVIDYLDARFTNAAKTAYNNPGAVSTSTLEAARNLNDPASVPLSSKAGVLYQKTVSGITQANPAVVTYGSATGAQALELLADGDRVTFASVGGMTQVNNNGYIIAGRAATTFQLSGTNSSAYSAYTSGGLANVDHAKWGHSRGLYVDYLEPDAITAVENAKTDCASQSGSAYTNCVLKVLPFTSINLSEIADWLSSDSNKSVVTNNDFSQALNYSDPVRGKVSFVPGATDNTDVNVSSQSRKQNTSLLDLSFDSISPADDVKLSDAQVFHITDPAPVAVAGNGKFYVGWSLTKLAGYYTNYITGSQASQSCQWNADSVGHPNKYECNVTNATVSPAAGLTTANSMKVVIGGYNQSTTPTTVTTPIPNCTNSDGKGGAPLTYSPALLSPAQNYLQLNCSSYTVTSNPVGSSYVVSPTPNANGGFQSETTTISYTNLAVGDVPILTFTGPTVYHPAPTCTYTCSKSSCSSGGNKITYTVNSGSCQ